MEYCEHGDLKKYLLEIKVLPEDQVKDIAYQVLGGVALMHEVGFANRDIKPAVRRAKKTLDGPLLMFFYQNILIKSKPPNSWWVKICDLGLSKRMEDIAGSTTVRGTPGFMPPESLGFYGHPGTA